MYKFLKEEYWYILIGECTVEFFFLLLLLLLLLLLVFIIIKIKIVV